MASCGTSLLAVGASVPNPNSFKIATKHYVCSVSRKSKRGLIVVTRIGSCRHTHPLGLYSDCGTSFRVSKIMASSTTETEKFGIKIVNNPTESDLSELGVRSWPKWGCPPSKFPWTYSSKETCYLLEGRVKVYPDESDEAIEIGAGDLVVFPKGMRCTWDVSEAVDKHYKFE